jgi:hypothetical protein
LKKNPIASKPLSRRQILQAGGAIGLGLLIPGLAHAAIVRALSGTVYINRQKATIDSSIRAGDLVTTSHDGRISFSIDGDAFLLKERTSLKVGTEQNILINTLRLLTGKLLSVFETGRKREIITTTATIGIRGTACFLNVEPNSTYYCNCYGKTELRAENIYEEFEATHHNAHRIDFDGMQLMGMAVMKVIDHSDDELRMLESYVGRTPRFDQVSSSN